MNRYILIAENDWIGTFATVKEAEAKITENSENSYSINGKTYYSYEIIDMMDIIDFYQEKRRQERMNQYHG